MSDTSHQTNADVGADKTRPPESYPTAHTTVHKLAHLAITQRIEQGSKAENERLFLGSTTGKYLGNSRIASARLWAERKRRL